MNGSQMKTGKPISTVIQEEIKRHYEEIDKLNEEISRRQEIIDRLTGSK